MTMKALQFNEYGGPEVSGGPRPTEPHAGPGQIRIRVKAASINPIDWKISTGMLRAANRWRASAALGFDAAGVVDEVGEGVTGVEVGDDVFGLGQRHPGRVRRPRLVGGQAVVGRLGGRRRGRSRVETAERGLRLLGVAVRVRPCSSTAAPAAWGGRVQMAVAARHHRDRLGGRGQPGLPARDRRHSGALRRGLVDRVRAAAGRQGRRGLRRGRQDPDRRADRARPRAGQGRHDRQLRGGRFRCPDDRRRRRSRPFERWPRAPACWRARSW